MGLINLSIIGINMSYQALARKWRPRTFQQMVGQEHVLQALINALSHNRLHHAYLFTGTRGVGKTTITRIFAKSLNCETGVTATPCGQCSICCQIDKGNFIDLIEIDAASRTKVEDTRELLDSVQYVPHAGRYKVYVIDEVHMLSGHSFNALLKTLEEPPQHTKFLLATTDPQKLPVTILSRCLQFHLKHLSSQQIADHLAHILQDEKIHYELLALKHIAKVANGSMRDGLSLLDQAIAFCNYEITPLKIEQMLGSIQTVYFYRLVDAICAKSAQQVFTAIDEIAQHTADFGQVLDELLSVLHQMAVVQLIPEVVTDFVDVEKLQQWANALTPAEVQLFYQIALMGRRDLLHAPSAQTGFEMVLLRMLFFAPKNSVAPESDIAVLSASQKSTIPTAPQAANLAPQPERGEFTRDLAPDSQATENTHSPPQASWSEIVAQLDLTGLTKSFASECMLQEITDTHIYLLLNSSHTILLNEKQRERLEQALNHFYHVQRKLEITVTESEVLSPATLQKKQQEKQQQAAFNTVAQDPVVQKILQTFNATIAPENIEVVN